MTQTKRETLTVDEVMEILDWLDVKSFDWLDYIMTSKADGPARVERALPYYTAYCAELLSKAEDAVRDDIMDAMAPDAHELLEREMRRACA